MKKGIERLEGFKFYEIDDPYYALIKATYEEVAAKLYIDIVAGSESEFDEIKDELKEVDMLTAIGKYYTSYENEVDESLEQYFEYLLEEKSTVLLVDGSLL